MPRVSKEEAQRKVDEIIDACAQIYDASSYRMVTIKGIADKTSLSRPSIYNYFGSLEEIFLGLLGREYDYWKQDLEQLAREHEMLDQEQFASEIARTLESRQRMLRLQSMNLFEIEENSSLERLTSFKRSCLGAVKAMKNCLRKYFPQKTADEVKELIYEFFPFLYGVYPYTYPTRKQMRAMEEAGMERCSDNLYELIRRCLLKLLQ